jgi:hypothetical protein
LNIIDAYNVLAGTLLRGRLTESRAFFDMVKRQPGRNVSGIVGIAIDDEEHVTLFARDQTAILDDKPLRALFEGFDLPLRQIVTGPIVPAARPARGGDSIGTTIVLADTGSIACAVKDACGTISLLTCNHVVSGIVGAAPVLDVLQPGQADGGGPADRIGTVTAVAPIVIGGVVANTIDAALVTSGNPADVNGGIRGIGNITGTRASSTCGSPYSVPFRMPVLKYGYATLLTTGRILFQRISHIMTFPGHGDALFEDQYGVVGDIAGSDFSTHGDSGALLVNASSEAIGLVFATATGIDLTLANPIDKVFAYFGVQPL